MNAARNWDSLPGDCRVCKWERGGPNCACAKSKPPEEDRVVNALCVIVPLGLLILFVLGLVLVGG